MKTVSARYFYYWAVPMTWDNFPTYRTNCAIMCSTRAYILRGFSRINAGKERRNSQNHIYVLTRLCQKSLMPLAHSSIRSCLLECDLSIFVVSCSSLSEVFNLSYRFKSLTALRSAASFTRAPHHSIHSKFRFC